MITGLNHITLAVADVGRSVRFYSEMLGAELAAQWPKGAYLELADVWLALVEGRPSPAIDYSHIALSCTRESFEDLRRSLERSGCETWSQNRSEGLSHYFRDPDGHQLEIHVGDLETRLVEMNTKPWAEFSTLRAPRAGLAEANGRAEEEA